MAKNDCDVVMASVLDISRASIVYTVPHGASATIKETIINAVKRRSHHIDVIALNEVSLQLNSKEVLAVIGKNGAGKSTLLKLMARVVPPTSGRIVVRGSVAPMIELGAGFNGDLSGRENIVLYGSLLGRTPKEMKERIKEIAAWANLTEYLDLPLRTYSSGMIARLAFAIATDKSYDLVLIDEVLSVGDVEFQEKSKARMGELIESQSAVVLVTHDLEAARELAHKAVWIDHGRIIKFGEVNSVVDAYLGD